MWKRSVQHKESAPYQAKFTLFANEADMAESKNQGFVVLDAARKLYKVRFMGNETTVTAVYTTVFGRNHGYYECSSRFLFLSDSIKY